jgi:hypothetical protein
MTTHDPALYAPPSVIYPYLEYRRIDERQRLTLIKLWDDALISLPINVGLFLRNN